MSWPLTVTVLIGSALGAMMPVGSLGLTLEDSPVLVGTLDLELEDSPDIVGTLDLSIEDAEDVQGAPVRSRVGTLQLDLEDAPDLSSTSVPVGTLGLQLEGDEP